MDILALALQKEAKKKEKYAQKSTKVHKHLDVEYDIGNLLVSDPNELDAKALESKNCEEYLRALARDNVQLLVNQLWTLPTERYENALVAKLPPGTTVIPREKPCPKPRAMTKWQKYAQEKGIKKKKKTNVVWDDMLQKWVPRFGYKRAEADKQKDWVIEVPGNADPMEDQFAKRSEKKKEKVAKNEYQRLRNIAAAKKIKVPKEGLPPVEKPSVSQMRDAVGIARSSTASLGRFQKRLPKEKKVAPGKELGIKRKKANHALLKPPAEKSAQLAIADSILNKRPTIDIEKAVNKQIHEEQQERSEEKKNRKPKAGRRKQGVKSGKVNKGRGGKRMGKVGGAKKGKAGGRKRR